MDDHTPLGHEPQPRYPHYDQCPTCGRDRVLIVVYGICDVAVCRVAPTHCATVKVRSGDMDFTEEDRWYRAMGV